MLPRVTIPFGSQQIVGQRHDDPILMPSAIDTTKAAAAFRQRNKGKRNRYCTFRGVPFTTSIVADGWWSEPSALNDLPANRFDATRYKRIAIQTTGPQAASDVGWRPNDGKGKATFEWADWGVVEDPDCGLLDIWTPTPTEGAGYPVVVNIHGGGNTENPRMLPRFTGDGLMPYGVVYVAVEWPLSLQGFFSHPEFATDSEINHAYRVVLTALEWVQAHISKFGGNPAEVCITGTSAGAQMCTELMPHGGDLFHRVLAHSGGGNAKHATRQYAAAMGFNFWSQLVKDKPAHFDPSRTIREIAEEDGIEAALRLGPSPEQLLAFANNRQTWELSGSTLVRGSAGAINVWPAQDGDLVMDRSCVGSVIAGQWPTDVQFWATWVFNEASLVGDAKTNASGADYLRRVGVTSAADIDTAVALLQASYSGRWQRPAYGHCLFGYAVDRLSREFAAQGGTAYATFVDYDSLGNGRRKMGHANQQVWWHGKAQWQVAMGLQEHTLRLYESDTRLQYHLARSLAAYARVGDPNAEPLPGSIELYAEADLEHFAPWKAMDDDRITNVVRNRLVDPDVPTVAQVPNFDKAIFDFFDTTYAP